MADENKKLLVIIDNVVYDLTVFKEHHPGGRTILEQYHLKDATDVFWSFHGKEGHEKLKMMKGVEFEKFESKEKAEMSIGSMDQRIKNFRNLRRKFHEEGYFQPNFLWQIYKCSTSMLLFALGVFATAMGHWIIGSILFGIGYQQMGWLGHDACHHNLTPNRKLNNLLGLLFGNFFSGFSANWWKDRHNTHHAITNVLNSDPDVDNLPLFVWSEFDLHRVLSEGGGFAQTIIPYQHLYFVPWTTTLKLIWCLQSIFFLKNEDIQNKSYRRSLVL